ncbi:Abi family protein [Holdemanella porci]|uniref:Abi family protein n=1 Tax=Holdemanella porci TaxID=2652276 RepID=UPI003AF0FC47
MYDKGFQHRNGGFLKNGFAVSYPRTAGTRRPDYSQFPIWVIIEFFSMGMLSYLYADLKSADQKMIAKKSYHTSSVCLKSWLRCLTDL